MGRDYGTGRLIEERTAEIIGLIREYPNSSEEDLWKESIPVKAHTEYLRTHGVTFAQLRRMAGCEPRIPNMHYTPSELAKTFARCMYMLTRRPSMSAKELKPRSPVYEMFLRNGKGIDDLRDCAEKWQSHECPVRAIHQMRRRVRTKLPVADKDGRLALIKDRGKKLLPVPLAQAIRNLRWLDEEPDQEAIQIPVILSHQRDALYEIGDASIKS
ncbi:MAG: hypothetical protein ABIG30_01730 [Candidatus Aenigmatarchaeota archaeon]